MKTEEQVIRAVNLRYDRLFNDVNGKKVPYVCISCDELLAPKDVKVLQMEVLKQNEDSMLGPEDMESEVLDAYMYEGMGAVEWMKNLILSPRASFVNKCDGRMNKGFSCCYGCLNSIKNGYTPKFALCNYYGTGCLPKCLAELTDIELSLISPVKTHGYL